MSPVGNVDIKLLEGIGVADTDAQMVSGVT
jgi:hypothetical protein